MEDWDKYITNDKNVGVPLSQSSGDNWDKYAVGDIAPQQQQPSSSDILPAAIGIGAVGGAGYGAYKGAKALSEWYNKPKVERNQLVKELQATQSQLGIEGRLYQTPKLAKTKISDLSNTLKQRIDEFDSVLALNSQEASDVIMNNFDKWKNTGYSNYKQGLDVIDNALKAKKIKIDSGVFNKNVIQKTIDDAMAVGVPEANLTKLKGIRESTLGTQTGSKFKKPITFTQAKGYIDEINKLLPPKAQYKMTENWGNFIENNIGGEFAKEMKDLNSNYKSFAEVRNRISEMVDPSTGQLNPSKLNKYLYSSVKSKFDNGVVKLFDFLDKGNKLSASMEGAKMTSESLLKNKAARDEYISKAAEQINTLKKMLPAVEKQVENLKIAQAKVDKRSILSGIRLPFIDKPLVTKGLPLLGGAMQAIDALRASKSLPAYALEQQTGVPMESTIEARNAFERFKNKKASPADIDMLIKSGVIS